MNLELSPAYEQEAKRLAREEGFDERIAYRLHDIASEPATVEPADIVVLHRVVCCYPDYRRLLGAAGDHARRYLVFSYPPRHAVSRLFIGAQNLIFRFLKREFRTFAHPPTEMLAVLEAHGLQPAVAHRAVVWQVAGCERR